MQKEEGGGEGEEGSRRSTEEQTSLQVAGIQVCGETELRHGPCLGGGPPRCQGGWGN